MKKWQFMVPLALFVVLLGFLGVGLNLPVGPAFGVRGEHTALPLPGAPITLGLAPGDTIIVPSDEA